MSWGGLQEGSVALVEPRQGGLELAAAEMQHQLVVGLIRLNGGDPLVEPSDQVAAG